MRIREIYNQVTDRLWLIEPDGFWWSVFFDWCIIWNRITSHLEDITWLADESRHASERRLSHDLANLLFIKLRCGTPLLTTTIGTRVSYTNRGLKISVWISASCRWVRSWNCDGLVTWFCYQLIAKPGNKTATVSWPNPVVVRLEVFSYRQNLDVKCLTLCKFCHDVLSKI